MGEEGPQFEPNPLPQEQPGQTENAAEKELSPEVIEKIMEKVIDFKAPENQKGIFIHQPGYQGTGSAALGGIFNAEKILQYGILSRDLANRAGVERSAFGHDPVKSLSYQRGIWGDSLAKLSKYSEWCFLFKAAEKHHGKDQLFSEKEYRIKPKDIVGIAISQTLLNESVENFLHQSPFKKEIARQLIQTKKDLSLHVSLETENLLSECARLGEEALKNRAQFYHKNYDNKRFGEEGLSREAKRQYDEYSELAHQNWEKIIGTILPLVREDKRFSGINTFGDYIMVIGRKFETPTYSLDGGLIFPKQMSYEEVQKFVAERDAKKTKENLEEPKQP